MRRRSAARRRLPSSRTTKNKRSFSSMIEIVMHILHHCNHEPALSARIEKTYLGNVDNKMKTRLSKSPVDAAKLSVWCCQGINPTFITQPGLISDLDQPGYFKTRKL